MSKHIKHLSEPIKHIRVMEKFFINIRNFEKLNGIMKKSDFDIDQNIFELLNLFHIYYSKNDANKTTGKFIDNENEITAFKQELSLIDVDKYYNLTCDNHILIKDSSIINILIYILNENLENKKWNIIKNS